VIAPSSNVVVTPATGLAAKTPSHSRHIFAFVPISALAPFRKVAELLSVGGAPNAGMVRNRSMRVGEAVVQPNVTTTAKPATPRPGEPVAVGLDSGYVRGQHREDERHF
jgi:hypothetical protein